MKRVVVVESIQQKSLHAVVAIVGVIWQECHVSTVGARDVATFSAFLVVKKIQLAKIKQDSQKGKKLPFSDQNLSGKQE